MSVEVLCQPGRDGHRCEVAVSDGGSTTRHLVRVTKQDLQHWGRARPVEDLVRDSFAFLLAREPKESILREFDLSVIQRYFPEYQGG